MRKFAGTDEWCARVGHFSDCHCLPAGVYNERYFQALDYILDEAAKVGVKLILTLADNWSDVDSKSQVGEKGCDNGILLNPVQLQNLDAITEDVLDAGRLHCRRIP